MGAASSARGERARGVFVQDEALQDRALTALQRKYGWQLSLAMLVYRLRVLYRDRWCWS
jgi:hypothetical protein